MSKYELFELQNCLYMEILDVTCSLQSGENISHFGNVSCSYTGTGNNSSLIILCRKCFHIFSHVTQFMLIGWVVQ
jgi:hypothetical protein